MMNQKLKEQYDKLDFVYNPNGKEYQSRLGDDTDTLVGCSYLKHVGDIEVGTFYDFEKIYVSDKYDEDKAPVGVDMSLIQDGERCWDNHIQMGKTIDTVNTACANINSFKKINASSRSEYHKKYAGSTSLQMFAYYDGVKPKTEEASLLWLAIDSGYKGHYNSKFKGVHNAYLEELGLTYMIDLLDKYNYEYMVNFANEHGLNSKIKLDSNGKLFNVGKWMKQSDGRWLQGKPLNFDFLNKHLGFGVALPTGRFELQSKLQRNTTQTYSSIALEKDNVFSMAYTYANQIEYTTYLD